MMNYAMELLQNDVAKRGPLCIGLDTDPSYIPPEVCACYDHPSDAVLAYNKRIIEAAGQYAACFKVQIAYYEAMGIRGLTAYAQTLQAVRAAGFQVIADIKRGDIADTAKAYAHAHFCGDFEADIITINPYMGFDTLEPFLEYVQSQRKGVFALLRTSNPGMKDIEQQVLQNGKRVLDCVGDALVHLGERISSTQTDISCLPVGAVVGCTEESDARLLRDAYPTLFFLIPGYGAQGGVARIAHTLLEKAGGTVNSSRAILTAWKKSKHFESKAQSNTLTLDDISVAAAEAAYESQQDLSLKKSI